MTNKITLLKEERVRSVVDCAFSELAELVLYSRSAVKHASTSAKGKRTRVRGVVFTVDLAS